MDILTGDFHLDDDHIIAPFNMDDDEPYEVENSGYMSNYDRYHILVSLMEP
ncbi:MAG: hypothetical protein IPJ13_18545 [Saprospiraceae bacterium]|nr:hypothetical protein [Saprospiraceae bacterium]